MAKKNSSIFYKIALFSLSITMCLNMVFTTSYAASEDYAKDIEILQLLSIVEESLEVSTFNPDAVVNRATFANYFAKMLNLSTNGYTELYFNDVPDTHYAYDEITALTAAGYFEGVGDKTFRPEDDMKIEYTYKLFASALGATPLVDFDAKNPNAAVQICSSMGVLDGVKATYGPLTEGDLFKMMKNALLAEVYGMDSPQGSLSQGEDTLLYLTRDMRYVKQGVLTTIGMMSTINEPVDVEYAVISGKTLFKPEQNIDEYIGRTVQYIYMEPDTALQDEPTLVWIDNVKDNDVLEITVTPDCKYSASTGKLSYFDENDNERYVVIPESITLIYNGAYKGTNIKSVFDNRHYTLRLVKEANGAYTTAIVWEHTPVLVDFINAEDFTVVDKLTGASFNFDPDEYDSFTMISTAGIPYDFATLTTNTVLNVYESEDGTVLKVVVDNSTDSGVIESKNEESIRVNGTKYGYYYPDYTVPYKLGQSVMLYFDINKNVIFAETVKGKDNPVGYLVKGSFNQDDEIINFRILGADGRMYSYTAAEKITVDGKVFKDKAKKAFDYLSDGIEGKILPQIIHYKTNADGKIVEVNTAHADDGGDYALYIDDVNKPYKAPGETSSKDSPASYSYFFGHKGGRLMGINSDTVIFNVPAPDTNYEINEKYCFVGFPGNGIKNDAVSYRTSSEPAFMEEYIVITTAGGGGAGKLTSIPAMYDSSYLTLNAEEEEVRIIKAFSSSGSAFELEVSPDCEFDFNKFTRGDVFNYKTNPLTGQLNDVELRYNNGSYVYANKGHADFTAEYRILFAYVNSVEPQGIRVGYDSGADFHEIIAWTGNVVIFDPETDKIFVGKTSDLNPYTGYGNDCSVVITGSTYGAPNSMFAIK